VGAAAPAAAAPLGLGAATRCVLPDASPSAALRVVGNRVVNGQDKNFIFYGISVFGGLQDGALLSDWYPTQGSSQAQIEAAPYWHSNTVRIQASESALFAQPTPGLGVSLPYLDALCHQVQLARSEDMQVVLNDQTEFQGSSERDATVRTIAFWRVVASIYGNAPGVTFDVFNEPRLLHPASGLPIAQARPHSAAAAPTGLNAASDAMWRLWQKGGTIDGVHYVGMQALVNAIRSLGVQNLIWLEGPDYGSTLSRLPEFPISGSNLVYATHHVPFGRTVAASRRLWSADFGRLSSKYAIVDGEWSQFASPKAECRPNAYRMAPAYLDYLHAHHVGLVAWSLQAGSLVQESSDALPTNITYSSDPVDYRALLQPSQMHPNYACSAADAGEGAGRLVLNFFTRFDTPQQMLSGLTSSRKPGRIRTEINRPHHKRRHRHPRAHRHHAHSGLRHRPHHRRRHHH
jgi:hypothetical protein